MKNKLLKLGILIVIIFFGFQSIRIVQADHDHYFGDGDYYKQKKYEKHKKHDDDWDDDYYWEGGKHKSREKYSTDFQKPFTQPSYWNIWTRDLTVATGGSLPFQEAKEAAFELNGKSIKLLVLPSNGQLLVSGQKMADFLGIQYKFYEQSKILEISSGNEELIIRAGSNAAYENMVKTPMPAKAMYYEKNVYLPVSVICNAFGYSVDWNEEKSTFILQSFD